MEVNDALATLVDRQHAARDSGDEAEDHRLAEVMRPLLDRQNEITAVITRRYAATGPTEPRRLLDEESALWDSLVAFWRAKPFDPHTI